MEQNRDRTVHQNFLRIMKEKKRKEEAHITATFRKAQNEHKLLGRQNPSVQVKDHSVRAVALTTEGLGKKHGAIGAIHKGTEGPFPKHMMIDAWSASSQQDTDPTAIRDSETDQLMNEVEGKSIHKCIRLSLTSWEGQEVGKAYAMEIEWWQQGELRMMTQGCNPEMRDFDGVAQAEAVTGLKVMEGTSVQFMRRRNPLEYDEFKRRKNDTSSKQQLRIEEAKNIPFLVMCLCCSTDNVLMLLLRTNRGGSSKLTSTKPPGKVLC